MNQGGCLMPTEVNVDFLIVGGGVAGLTAAQYGARANLSTIILDSSGIGGQALLIDKLENYPGVFPPVSGAELTETMKKQAESFGAKFINDKVQSVDKMGQSFVVRTNEKTFFAKALLWATGAIHKTLGIPGEKEFAGKGVSYCATCDGPFFRGKKISVIGGGDAACDEANFLTNLTDQVYLIHRRDSFRAQASVAERALNNPKITPLLNCVPIKINGTDLVESILLKNIVTGEEFLHETDAVFIFVGMAPQTEMVEILKTDENGYILTDENMMTSVKGLFCAGDLRAKPFRQVVTACADGAYAAFAAEKYIQSL